MRFAGPALLVALTFVLWVLQHPYAGIYHDAQLYTIQALARVDPAGLSQDIFLRYGSQDSFTCFGPLYAAAIRAFGTAGAAALLTFLSQLAFASAAVLLARCLLPGNRAWLGAGLLCVIPLTYGAHKVFYVMEDFVTPRLLAESLVFAGLAALLTRRYKVALLSVALAALVHPIMALTGCLVGVFLDPVERRWRGRLFVAAGIMGLILVGVLLAHGTPLRFDDEWWRLVHDGLPYLFPLEWRKFDWARVIVVATFLYAGARRLPDGSARMLCRVTLAVTGAALALSVLGADVLRLVLVTQLQLWRVLWLASALALLVAPYVVPTLWRGDDAARIALVAMLCAFLLSDERFALSSALTAAAALLLTERLREGSPMLRPILLGLSALLALSLLINLASSVIVARAGIDQVAVPDWMRKLRTVSGTGVLPGLALCTAAWAAARMAPGILGAAAVASLALAAWFGGAALPAWLQSPFSASTQTAFASWRDRIPHGAEVLWFTSPVAAWVVLERPSYASVQQRASSLFSREAAMILQNRLAAVPEFLLSADSRPWLPGTGEEREGQGTLAEVCDATQVGFVVTRKDLGTAPMVVSELTLPATLRGWKLYACEPRAVR
jgi:hypothetical protein